MTAAADGTGAGAGRPGIVARGLILLVRGYQLVVSPWLGPRCRFVPSCSAYALEAFRVHGAVRGLWLTVWRLARCQPFCAGGHDPVPEPARRRRRGHNRGSDIGGAAGSVPPSEGAAPC